MHPVEVTPSECCRARILGISSCMPTAWPPEGAISVTCRIRQIKRVSLAPSVHLDGLTFSDFPGLEETSACRCFLARGKRFSELSGRGPLYPAPQSILNRRSRPTSGADSRYRSADLRQVMMGLHTNCPSFCSRVHDSNSAAGSHADHRSFVKAGLGVLLRNRDRSVLDSIVNDRVWLILANGSVPCTAWVPALGAYRPVPKLLFVYLHFQVFQ